MCLCENGYCYDIALPGNRLYCPPRPFPRRVTISLSPPEYLSLYSVLLPSFPSVVTLMIRCFKHPSQCFHHRTTEARAVAFLENLSRERSILHDFFIYTIYTRIYTSRTGWTVQPLPRAVSFFFFFLNSGALSLSLSHSWSRVCPGSAPKLKARTIAIS